MMELPNIKLKFASYTIKAIARRKIEPVSSFCNAREKRRYKTPKNGGKMG
jgi:hypothetical protein